MTSELKVDKISPASGTSFTLGDSGDTFTIPSGATITNSGTASGFAPTGITSNMTSGTGMTLNSDGSINKPLQPCFLATITGETRNGQDSITDSKYATEIFDVGSDYNNSTYTFTAPVTGKYQFNITMGIAGISQGNDVYIRLDTSNRDMNSRMKCGADVDMLTLSMLVDMDASDTAKVRFQSYDDASVEFYSDRSQFSGYLVC